MKDLGHRIERAREITLIGVSMRMSLALNKTAELWQIFMPRHHEIKTTIGNVLYSVEVYDDLTYFTAFDPTNEFDKWAGVAVERLQMVPEGMSKLLIPAGEYIVFDYKGRPSEVGPTYQFIYGHWLPNSEYKLDNRPHFALMGERYKGEHPDSEEELWIPVVYK